MPGKEFSRGRPVRSIVFDLDGTLIDSAPAVGGVLNLMRAETGLTPLPIDAFRRWISLGADELMRRALEIGPQEAPSRLNEFRRLYRAEPARPDHLYPGVAATLAELRRRGLRMAICSNKPAPLCRKIVDELALSACFDAVVGGEPDRPAKPDPAPLDRALAAMEADPRASLFVGDSSIDQKAAASRAIPFVFFAEGYDDGVARLEAFRVIRRMDELLGLVQ
jgi:phosphoglycolate phosphatase